MTDKQDLQNLLKEINSIDEADIKKPAIPFEIYIYEAERLYTRASEDLPKLTAINMPANLIDNLRMRTNALRKAQLNWVELNNDKKKANADWKAAKPELLKLHKELIQSFQFAFRNNEVAMQKLSKIKKGNSMDDMLMDLCSLSVLGKDNSKLLEAINFDLSLLDRAAETSERMAKVKANKNGRLYFQDDMLVIRNKAYTLLKECVDEVRKYGQFAFADQPNIAQAYASKYRREKKREYLKKCKLNKSDTKNEPSTP